MSKMIKVALLARPSRFSSYLAHVLQEQTTLVGVVFEQRTWKHQLRILTRRCRRIGAAKVVDQLLLKVYTSLFESRKDHAIADRLLGLRGLQQAQKAPVLKVQDINDHRVLDFLKQSDPSLVIVNGTSLIKPALIHAFTGPMVNVHVGITPEYRGSYGGFWALYDHRIDRVGVTLHTIDEGIDTGQIIAHGFLEIKETPTLKGLVYEQQRLGLELLMKLIEQWPEKIDSARYGSQPRRKGRFFYPPGLTDYLKWKKWWLAMKSGEGRD